MLIPANVVRIDRSMQRVEVAVVGQSRTIYAQYPDKKRPPPPLAPVYVEPGVGGQWRVREVPALRQQIVADDFTTLIFDPGIAYHCDTAWTAPNWQGAGAAFGNSNTDMQGSMQVCTDIHANDNTTFTKADATFSLQPAPSAMWYSGRFVTTTNANLYVYMGLANFQAQNISVAFPAGAYGVWLAWDAFGTQPGIHNINNGVETTLSIATGMQPTTTFIVDLVVADTFSAAWVDGDGPYVLTTGAMPAPVYLAPFFGAYTYVAATRCLLADWVNTEIVTPVMHPDLLYSLLPTDTSAVGHSYLGTRT